MDRERDADPELSLADYARILRNRWLAVLTPILIFGGLAAYSLSTRTLQYESTSKVLLADTAAQAALRGGSQNPNSLTREMTNEISFAASDDVKNAVRDAIGVVPKVTVRADPNSDVLSFTGKASDPGDAAMYANTWAEAFVSTKQKQAGESLDAAVDQFSERVAVLRAQRDASTDPADQARIDSEIDAVNAAITNLQLTAGVAAIGTAQVVQVASSPTEPTNLDARVILAIALALGFAVGSIVAFVIDNLDRRIKTSDDIIRAVGLPVLGTIARASRKVSAQDLALAVSDRREARVADGYQKVRSSLQFALLGRDVKSILITSANESEGKTTTSSNLAWALAAVGSRVVLADIDFRRPKVHAVYGLAREPGFSNHLVDRIPLHELVAHVEDDERTLAVLPSGTTPHSPGDFLASPDFLETLRWIESEADVVVLDAPPVLPVSDTLAIAHHVDRTILTASAGSTTVEQLQTAVESLRAAGASIAGVVLVGGKQDRSYGTYTQQQTTRRARRSRAESRKTSGTGATSWSPAPASGVSARS
ncbi:MAG: polysaccharide biosynthesis tyrosine autokinase [Acidimicrobiales bacterium]